MLQLILRQYFLLYNWPKKTDTIDITAQGSYNTNSVNRAIF